MSGGQDGRGGGAPFRLGSQASRRTRMAKFIYKIATRQQWAEAEKNGAFAGAPVDIEDGYIHFSSADQLRETAAKHFTAQDDLVLVAVPTDALGQALRWEPSRGGALFPHLHAPLDLGHVAWIRPLPLGSDGMHQFPDLDG